MGIMSRYMYPSFQDYREFSPVPVSLAFLKLARAKLTYSSFTGKITHSRFYRCPDQHAGKTILIVGSFASGSDLSRQIASLNLNPSLPRTKVYVSSSGDTSYAGREGGWAEYIEDVPLITGFEGEEIVFENGRRVRGVDEVIFATGYWYSLPFCRAPDKPWNGVRVLSDNVGGEKSGEKEGGRRSGIKGFHMDNLDPLQLFLKNDRSIAFPTLREFHISTSPSLHLLSTPITSLITPTGACFSHAHVEPVEKNAHGRIPSRSFPARRNPSTSPLPSLVIPPSLLPLSSCPSTKPFQPIFQRPTRLCGEDEKSRRDEKRVCVWTPIRVDI